MINHLKLEHFKAFRDPAELDFDGKNVLIFGENGAGKSSLYQALKIIFHRQKIFDKEIDPIIKDPKDRRNAENDVLAKFNYQATPLTNFTLEINGTDYKAYSTTVVDVSMISREDLRVEDKIDVIDVLEKSFVGIKDAAAFVASKKETIETLLNSFLKEYFYEEKLTIALTFNNPRWLLTISDTSRDSSGRNEELALYFNEAKLHIIKLLLLLTAVQYNGARERGDELVLVLDDVFTSMDSANRTLFIELLKEYFGDYQKIIMTHSISFFNLAVHAFTIAYQQKNNWKLYQIVEHEANSEIEPRGSQDYASIIYRDYKRNVALGTIGNRIRKRFEFLVGEVSKLVYTGGLAECSKLIEAINTPKKLYYEYNGTKTNTVYDMIDELTAIVDADGGSPLKSRLQSVIDRYVSDTEVEKLRDTIRDLSVYQKVSMHPLSHATGALPLSTTKEVERSITLLMTLEKQIGTLINKDLYSM